MDDSDSVIWYMVVTSEQKTTPPNELIGLSLSKIMMKRTKILLLNVLAHIAGVNIEVIKKKPQTTNHSKHTKSQQKSTIKEENIRKVLQL